MTLGQQLQKSGFRFFAVAAVCGIGVSLFLGLLENTSAGGLIGATPFGYPWPWRFNIVHAATQVSYRFDSLAANVAFWTIIFFVASMVVERIAPPSSQDQSYKKKLALITLLLIPLGFVMCLVHETGHALGGTAVGGTLSYMQVTYFVLYPELAVASQFRLGYVVVTGLSKPAHGFFLLAGSLTTNIAAWLIGFLLYVKRQRLSFRSELGLRLLGWFGVLDMPLYVAFPLIGLQHWILLGGSEPEPLIGAREIGMPDPIFYTIVILLTLGLILLYTKAARIRLLKLFSRKTR